MPSERVEFNVANGGICLRRRESAARSPWTRCEQSGSTVAAVWNSLLEKAAKGDDTDWLVCAETGVQDPPSLPAPANDPVPPATDNRRKEGWIRRAVRRVFG
jgi:hypothetical protein